MTSANKNFVIAVVNRVFLFVAIVFIFVGLIKPTQVKAVWACSINGNYVCPGTSDQGDCTTSPQCSADKNACKDIDSANCGKATSNGSNPTGVPGSNPAPTGVPSPNPAPSGVPQSNTGSPDVDCKANPNSCLYNPLPTSSLKDMFLIIVRGFLYMTGIISVIFIIIGGFRMVIAQGDEEAYGVAKKTITWAVIGLVIALLSFSIIAIVENVIGATLPGGF